MSPDRPTNPGTLYGSAEGRIVHSWEWTKMLIKDRRTMAILVPILIAMTLLATTIGVWWGTQQPLSTPIFHGQPTALLQYRSIGHHVTIQLQRENGTYKAFYFELIITTLNAHKVRTTKIIEMRASPPPNGSTYLLTCTIDSKHPHSLCGILVLAYPPIGENFDGGGALYLLIFPSGYYPLTGA